jgi:hypothetical protein
VLAVWASEISVAVVCCVGCTGPTVDARLDHTRGCHPCERLIGMENNRHDLQPLRGNSPRRSKCYSGRALIDLADLQSKVLGHLLTSPAMTMPTAAIPVGPGSRAGVPAALVLLPGQQWRRRAAAAPPRPVAARAARFHSLAIACAAATAP